MGDSEDEYDRKRRDKFRGERAEATYRGTDRPVRPRDDWQERDAWSRPRAREYRGPVRDRGYSPGLDAPPKRFRPDYYGNENYYNHYQPYHPPPHRPGPREPPSSAMEGQQPPMMTFKAFLAAQDDNISDSEAVEKYNDYKLEFQRQQLNEFFVAHKDDEWFRLKYHPEDSVKRKEEQANFLKKRVDVFLELLNSGKFDSVSVDCSQTDELIRLLDTVVIKLEGGTDADLAILDQDTQECTEVPVTPAPEKQEPAKMVQPIIQVDVQSSEDWTEEIRLKDEQIDQTRKTKEDETAVEKEAVGEETKSQESEVSEKEKEDAAGIEGEEEEAEEEGGKEDKTQGEVEDKGNMEIEEDTEEKNETPGEVEKMQNGEKQATDQTEDMESEKVTEPESRKRKRSFSGSGGSSSGSSSDSDSDPDNENKPKVKKETTEPEVQKEQVEEKEEKEKAAEEETKEKQPDPPRALHRTTSIFLRNLAPTITRQEVEAMCSRYTGFLRVALAEPQPDRRWMRRGWVTFSRNANIKEICWNLNNIRLRDCELGAIVNRDLSRRIRQVNGITAHKQVVRSDIRISAKVVLHMDTKAGLWLDKNEVEKQQPSFGLVSNNPVLHNITDYLIEEASAEEEELLGMQSSTEETSTATVERDESLVKVLDKIILYLRVVHSIDYYNHCEYPNEDEMPNRCGILHARGPPPASNTDMTSHIGSAVECKMNQFLPEKVSQEENKNENKLLSIAMKDVDMELDKFVKANTRELAKDKWLCPLSGKKFKGPDFVRKHIFNKHGEKIEEVKKEVEFFNNYLKDPKRPMLAEAAPARREEPAPYAPPHYGGGFGGFNGPPRYYNQGFVQRPRVYPRSRGGGDYRPIIHYRDLDAPREPEEFV